MKPILLTVDDSPSTRTFTSAVLSKLDGSPEVLEAENGAEGVEIARARRPHVILMDWGMPVMDGLQATRILRADPETMDIPILMLTAVERESSNIREALEAGAMDFVAKPVDALELRARTASALRISMGTRALRASNNELSRLNDELRQALDDVKRMAKLLPICSFCKEVRSDDGYWADLETFLRHKAGTEFSHGICPGCFEREYPEIAAMDDEEEDATRPEKVLR